jgi:hypothetical protein
MARYTCSYLVHKLPLDQLQTSLSKTLAGCKFDLRHKTLDYMMAQEMPGQVSFSRLVTVEVLIDKSLAAKNEVQVNLVVKNEELPLQIDNHCRQMFDLIQQAIADNHQWQLVSNISSKEVD